MQQPKTASQRLDAAVRAILIGVTIAASSVSQAGDLNNKLVLDIPTQSLSGALTSLANQADLQILFSPGLVEGLRSAPLSGSYSGNEALRQLLAESGLEYTVDGADTVVIRQRNVPAQKATGQDDGADSARATSRPAQTQTDFTDSPLAEVIVTAQKRVERLQDVPLAVTAVSGDALAERQINDTNSLVRAVPSLSFQQGVNPISTSFRVRGVGTAVLGLGVEPAVSIVVDGVVAARAAQGFGDLADIARIEVLRGPQGTLFGKNSTAGVINVVTAEPSTSFAGSAEITAAEGNEYRARGTISGPLSDTVGARLSGYYNHVEGHVYNSTLDRDVNGTEGEGARGKLEWDATDALRIRVIGDYSNNDADCCKSVLVRAVNPAVAQLTLPAIAGPRNRTLGGNILSIAHRQQRIGSVQAEYDLGWGTITSISAYQDFKQYQNEDVDTIDTRAPIYVGPGNGANGSAASFDVNSAVTVLDNISQEVRISSNGQPRLGYVAGVYYSDLTIDREFFRRRSICASGTFGQPCAAPVYQSAQHFAQLNSSSIAAFGQGEYEIIDGLRALAGMRVQYEEVSVDGTRTGIPMVPGDLIFPGLGANSGKRSADDTAVTGKIGLQYEFSRNAQVYGSYTRGYKGLGFDTEITANFASQEPVLPEDVDAYEIGFKTQTQDGLLTFAAAAFLANYTNLQVNANRSDTTLGTISIQLTNAGTARTQGFEIEATLRPLDGLSLAAGVTYAETSIDADGLGCPLQLQGAANAAPPLTGNFPINTCYRSSFVSSSGATVVSGAQQNVRDGVLPAAPKWRANFNPRYEVDIGTSGFMGFVQANVSYESRQSFAIEQDPLLVQGAHAIVDASLGVNAADNRYTVTLFARNLFDRNYYTSLGHGSLLASTVNAYDLYAHIAKDSERYFGATVAFRFE